MPSQLLSKINNPKDLKKLTFNDLELLCKELRDVIITTVASKAGHLGASLGVVELSVSLHYIFNTPNDLLIWDVGHQAYVHKLLTGRLNNFNTNRQLGGLSGFPNREESIYDTFGVGHSSTSISAILGMAIASKIKKDNKRHIAVIGDASIASGMAFEGLNHMGDTNVNALVILNDNSIGIDPSVGALKTYLTNVKKGVKDQDNIFEALNFKYTGPIDGHNLALLNETLKKLKNTDGPNFLHVVTTKGKGLKQAEKDQVTYHAPGKFNAETGDLITQEKSPYTKYQDVFGLTLVELAKSNPNITGITPAMPTGSSLKFMMDAFPDRAIDVGIAEQHAVTLSAGMATQGLIPFCNIYSTFLQRAYDQIIHDVALQNLPVVFCLDRAGLVGEDGPTHHGVFDLSYLNCIPNLIVFAPRNEIELRNIMYTAQLGLENPIAIRYPRGRGKLTEWQLPFKEITIGKGLEIKRGSKIAILSVGTIIENAFEALKSVNDTGLNKISIYDMRFIKPLDIKLLKTIFDTHETIITIEDNAVIGGFGSAINQYAISNSRKNNIVNIGIPDEFITHGTISELQELAYISPNAILNKITEFL